MIIIKIKFKKNSKFKNFGKLAHEKIDVVFYGICKEFITNVERVHINKEYIKKRPSGSRTRA